MTWPLQLGMYGMQTFDFASICQSIPGNDTLTVACILGSQDILHDRFPILCLVRFISQSVLWMSFVTCEIPSSTPHLKLSSGLLLDSRRMTRNSSVIFLQVTVLCISAINLPSTSSSNKFYWYTMYFYMILSYLFHMTVLCSLHHIHIRSLHPHPHTLRSNRDRWRIHSNLKTQKVKVLGL